MSDSTFDAVDYLHAFADDATGCTPTASKSVHAIAADYKRLLAELQHLRADYRTLWGMTLGHGGQPPTDGTPDDIERLRARLTDLNGEGQ